MKLRLLRAAACLALLSSFAFAEKKKIVPPEFVRPAGAAQPPFSPGILIDGTLYIAGQTGADPATSQLPDAFEAEVKRALDNVGAVLKAAGMGFEDVVAVTVYLTDMDLFQRMNAVYTTYFHDPMPTRTTVGVAKLVSRSRIEITVTARK